MISLNAVTHSLSALEHVQVVEPEDRPKPTGGYWKGIKHHALVAALGKEAAKVGQLRASDHRILVWHGDCKMACAFRLYTLGGTEKWMGVMSSNGGDMSPRFYAGAVCGGVPLVFDRWAGSKLTVGFDLEQEAARAVRTWVESANGAEKEIARLRKCRLRDEDYFRLLVEAGREEIVPSSKLMKLDSLWQEGDGRTLWDFHQSAAAVVALTSGPNQLDHHKELHSLYTRFLEDK